VRMPCSGVSGSKPQPGQEVSASGPLQEDVCSQVAFPGLDLVDTSRDELAISLAAIAYLIIKSEVYGFIE